MLQVMIDSVQGASGSLQLGSFYTDFPELTSPNVSTTSPFSSLRPCNPENAESKQSEGGDVGPQTAASKSPSSSHSQSSSSSQCCSSGRQPHSAIFNRVGSEDPMMLDNDVSCQLKRVRSEVELNDRSQEGIGAKLTTGSQSHKILKETHESESPPAVALHGSDESCKGERLRVKVTYGEENIRFRLQKGWELSDLWREIRKRFGVEDPSRFDLKYLDDDSGWVLLTCNADLEESMGITRLSQGNTIRLSLQASHHYHGGATQHRQPITYDSSRKS